MTIDNRKPEDGPNPEDARVEKPEKGLTEDRDLETISGGIIYKSPTPPEV